MRLIRKLHLYLGCIFGPVLIYFCISGAWQLFGLNDIPKDAPPSALREVLHSLSNPHTNSTFPGLDPRHMSSALFSWFGLIMAVGIVLTTLLGIALAFRFSKRPWVVGACLLAGILLPIVLLRA